MPQQIATVTLDPSGPIPVVEVIFGFAQIGSYQCFLWDKNGANPTQIGHGNNIDNLPDVFPVGAAPTALTGRFISWQMVIQAPSAAPGQLYSYVVTIRQNGVVVTGGVLQDVQPFPTGALTVPVLLFARFA